MHSSVDRIASCLGLPSQTLLRCPRPPVGFAGFEDVRPVAAGKMKFCCDVLGDDVSQHVQWLLQSVPVSGMISSISLTDNFTTVYATSLYFVDSKSWTWTRM